MLLWCNYPFVYMMQTIWLYFCCLAFITYLLFETEGFKETGEKLRILLFVRENDSFFCHILFAPWQRDSCCWNSLHCTHTHPFNGPFSGTTQVSWYQKGKTSLDFTEASDIEWRWHQLGRMQVCTSLQTDNNASTLSLSFLQAGCPSCRPANSIKALKALRNISWHTG